MRLIDADALMKDLGITDFECTKCAWKGVYGCSRGSDFTDACFFLENAPTVDAVPVRHGHWEMKTDPFGFFYDIPVCSECGCTTRMREKTLYCPMCGARMDAE